MTTLEERAAYMPRLVPFRPAAVCALALLAFLSVTAAAPAKKRKVEASLRVVGRGGKVLDERTLRTGPTRIPTSRRATCFGRGTGGSGRAKGVGSATALGLLTQAASRARALRPLRITDAFSFGLGLCGIGGQHATKTLSWYLKVNHENPELGGEAVKLKPGDEVLWALAGFPYPDELFLEAPGRAAAGSRFAVRVFSYSDKGRRHPVRGARVTGAAGPTDAKGTTTVTLDGPRRLRARHGKDIPSNGVAVCVAGDCP
jgi:hypothetical protein